MPLLVLVIVVPRSADAVLSAPRVSLPLRSMLPLAALALAYPLAVTAPSEGG